ncbi:MAG: D-2-hydroxyacid dehydrogenase [Pirellulaceae bacterium]|nr:D-2-hydroxyacid dehydrogenase [Pirellulaceae bacterium]
MKIVVLDGSTLNPGDNPWTGLETLGEVTVHDRSSEAELLDRCRGAQVLVTNKVRLDERLLKALPELKFITVTATGHDCVDTNMARELGISASNVPVYGTDSVAQHIFALILHIMHRVDIHDTAVRAGEWSARQDFSFWKQPLTELTGKSIGIVGFGRIGRAVGQLAHAFGMQVLANSRSQKDRPSYSPFEWTDIETLTRRADIISLNCPLTDQTKGLVNRNLLVQCKSSLVLINAGRGDLIVEADVADALNNGLIAAAGLDVVSREPITADNPLLSAKNCFITPHQAWATLEARRRLMQITVDNISAFVAGQPQNLIT